MRNREIVSKKYVINSFSYTVRSESRCGLRLRYVDLVVSIDAHGNHFQQLL
jgi:hypothetical protein